MRQMLFMDAPAHTRLRGLASMAFSPARVAALREHIREIIEELMQPLLDNNQFADQPKAPIPETELEEVISAGSTLRTSLSDDIGTKRASWL